MKKLSIVLMFLFTTIVTSSAIGGGSYPDWVLPELKKYPIEKFIFDIGRSDGTDEEAFKEAIAKASKRVSEKVLRQVIGIISLNKSNVNYQSFLNIIVQYWKIIVHGILLLQHSIGRIRIRQPFP